MALCVPSLSTSTVRKLSTGEEKINVSVSSVCVCVRLWVMTNIPFVSFGLAAKRFLVHRPC